MDATEVQRKLTQSLDIAKESWEESDMPKIYAGHNTETGKIAIAILACKIFDEL